MNNSSNKIDNNTWLPIPAFLRRDNLRRYYQKQQQKRNPAPKQTELFNVNDEQTPRAHHLTVDD